MFHVMAFEEDIDNVANTELDIINDQIANGDNGLAYFQSDKQILFIYASSATLTRARLSSPKTRQIAIPYILPISANLLPPDDPNVMDLRNNPMVLNGLERFAPEFTSGVAMGTERAYCVLGVTEGLTPAPSGEITTLRATGTTTLVQGVWTDVPLTWDQQLARGRYDIVGGQLQSATTVAWRLILENQVWRPGGLGQAALGRRTHRMFYGGELGSWGSFFSTGLPRLQCMANAGDTAENLWLSVIRTGA